MFISKVTQTVKFDNAYFRIKKGQNITDLPKKLLDNLVRYNSAYEIKEKPTEDVKKKKKLKIKMNKNVEKEIIPEESADLEFQLEDGENQHKIEEEVIFNYRKEDDE